MAITLLPSEYRASGIKFYRLAKNATTTSYAILIFYILALMVLAGFFVYFFQKNRNLLTKREQLINDVKGFREQEILHLIVKDRVVKLVEASRPTFSFKKSFDLIESIESISQQASQSNLSVTNLSNDGNIVRFTVNGANIYDIGYFIEKLKESKEIKNAVMEQMGGQLGSEYSANILLSL